MKSVLIMVFALLVLSMFAFPVDNPVIGEEWGYQNPDYDIVLTNGRLANKVSIVCVDSLAMYIEIDTEILLKIPKSQVVSIDPTLPEGYQSFVYRNYVEGYSKWKPDKIRVIDLKPSCKYIVRALISEIDSCGGVSVSIDLYNFSKNRLKYALYTVKYYNAVDDLIASDIGNYSSQRCKATGFIEPGTHDGGVWDGFYNSTARSVKISSLTLTYSSGNQETFQRSGTSLLLIEN
ncbi:MAG: hypothetical protein Q8M98_06305 [Candidatus Cloacimonadaceae bacterium]|nr:hypothetical protein [Candidatus Cloacimonadaceae bacterium]